MSPFASDCLDVYRRVSKIYQNCLAPSVQFQDVMTKVRNKRWLVMHLDVEQYRHFELFVVSLQSIDGCGRITGMSEVIYDATQLLSNYCIEQGRVVHPGRRVASALIYAMQLCALPIEQLNESMCQKLHQSVNCVAQKGSKAQQALLLQSLRDHRDKKDVFFIDQIHVLQGAKQSAA